MLYFFDTSALVKRYHYEIGTEVIDQIFDDHSQIIAIPSISLSETTRALDKHLQQGTLTLEDVKIALGQLYNECSERPIIIIDITREYIFKANELILQYHLFAPDAMILASALELINYAPVFVCADVRSGLLRAAEASYLSTLNPLNP